MDTPEHADLRTLFACAEQGRFEELQQRAAALTQQAPALAIGWKALGLAHAALGRPGQALAAYERALAIAPADAHAQCQRAHALRVVGRPADAAAGYRQALALDPTLVEAHNHLGDTLQQLGRHGEAEACYRASLGLVGEDPQVLNNLGVALKNQGRAAEALDCYRRALARDPGHAGALGNQGVALRRLGRLADAEASLRRALEIVPSQAQSWSNLGVAVMDQGRIDEAEPILRRALAIDPGLADARSNLLFAFNHLARQPPAAGLAEARTYGQAVAAGVRRRFDTWNCTPRPQRLRVGLVSGDLRTHPVGYFLEGVLAQLPAQGIELIAYPADPRVDALGERLRTLVQAWHPIVGLPDEDAAQRIHGDAVHLLIDLSGHTAHNRLPVFAWKPAPVQATWLGYFATTGVAEIDWLIADAVGVPPEHHGHFTEKVWTLPQTRLCFTPPQPEVAVAPPPALARGHITFGSFQTLAKIGDEVLGAWAAVLARLPTARLRLQCKQLGDAAVAARLRARLGELGVAAERVNLHPAVPRAAYLAAFDEVDLLLDTFPFPGGTTTCEALWMGVPTLTIAGDRLLARQGASLLAAAGLPEWIATDVDDYVERAVAAAADLPALAALRRGLRAQVLASPLFDAPRFAHHLAQALWGMWAQRRQLPGFP